MNIKDIKKQLEKLENNEDRLDYLKKLLKKVDDEELEEAILSLIKGIEGLESKLENLPDIAPTRRQLELDDVEHDIETQEIQVAPRQTRARPDLNILQREEENIETNYTTSNYTINLVPQYLTQSIISYESLANQGIETSRIEESLIRENILNPESPLTDLSREQLHVKVRDLMPFASTEEIIKYEDKVLWDLKDSKKSSHLKYIPKLR